MKFVKQNYDPFLTKKLSEELDIPEFFIPLFFYRGLSTEHDILDYLLAEDKLRDPFLLPDMKKACERIGLALKNGEIITICGDYDVDGTLATTILMRFLRNCGAKVSNFIPHRTLDGYGISASTMEMVKEKHGTNVVISVDTGTTAFDAAEKAKELGMDLIVTDHHNLSDKGLPPVYALINAKREGCPEDFQMLAGSGIAYFFVRALNSYLTKEQIITSAVEDDYRTLAAMATVADVVPLKKDNRVIVKYGLQHLPYIKVEGMESLFGLLGLRNVTSKDIAWTFAPTINAAGRMGSAQQALELFLETNRLKAMSLAQDLIDLNKKRRKISQEVNKQVLEAGEKIVAERNPSAIVVAGKFHVGVIGISAAKLVDAYHRPGLVIGLDDQGYGKGSCRTIPGLNVKKALDYARKYIVEGGGHDMAAGFSILEENIPKFTEAIEEFFSKEKPQEKIETIESVIEFDALVPKSVKILEMMEPFGQDNPIPIVQINDLRISEKKVVRGGHLMYIFANDMRGFIFNPTEEQVKDTTPFFSAVGELSTRNGELLFVIKQILGS